MIYGTDVARYQGEIDWDAYRAAKDFVIIKATGGCPDPGEDDSRYLDSSFHRNRDEARRLGIPRGFYHYAYPEYNNPEQEAAYFARMVGDLQDGELVVLDYESSWTGNAVDFCLRWLESVENRLGVKPLIYLNLYTTKSHDWSPVISNGNGLWLAQWTYKADGQYDASQPWPFAAFHQYSNREQVAGISANVDGDTFMGDVAAFYRYGKQPVAVPPPTTQVPDPVPTTTTTTQVPTPEPTTTVDPVPPADTSPVGILSPGQWEKTAKALAYSFASGFIGGLILTASNYLQSGQPTDVKFLHSLVIASITGGVNGLLVFLKQLFSAK